MNLMSSSGLQSNKIDSNVCVENLTRQRYDRDQTENQRQPWTAASS